jgi:hypothetical protein
MSAAAMALTFPCIALAQPSSQVSSKTFALHVIETVNPCLSENGSTPPTVIVSIRRGVLNDTARIDGYGFKPGLQFDLFTVQRSNLDADGSPVANFPGFGLAWYQTDLEADRYGNIHAVIETILLDQIFGFDADKAKDGTTLLPPTNTFHVGFWFNNPEDAARCGFNVTKPTPFNGEHKAGPLAMISLPDEKTNLGPLCTSPRTSNGTAACNP